MPSPARPHPSLPDFLADFATGRSNRAPKGLPSALGRKFWSCRCPVLLSWRRLARQSFRTETYLDLHGTNCPIRAAATAKASVRSLVSRISYYSSRCVEKEMLRT
jgi:hypothetical protein